METSKIGLVLVQESEGRVGVLLILGFVMGQPSFCNCPLPLFSFIILSKLSMIFAFNYEN